MRKPRLELHGGVFLADDCTVVGEVTLGRDASVWYGVVIRGDVAAIRIGDRTNVQDTAVIHPQHDEDVSIGEEVTIGHAAVVHGRVVESRCLIGIKSVLLPGSVIGEGSIVAAGALVPEGRIVPPRSLVVGMPARVVRAVTDDELAAIVDSARRYVDYARSPLED